MMNPLTEDKFWLGIFLVIGACGHDSFLRLVGFATAAFLFLVMWRAKKRGK